MKQYYKSVSPFFNWRAMMDVALIVLLPVALILNSFSFFTVPIKREILIALSLSGFIPVLISVYFAVIKKQITVDLLAAIALFFTFVKGEWSSAALINLMLASARLFDRYVQARTKNIIGQLLKLRPSKVKIKLGDTISEIPIDRVKVGDLAVIEAGSRIPVDGVVVSGQASIDESTLTGESERVVKRMGDKVFSSTVDELGSLLVQVEKIGEDTTFSKILALVEEAGRSKTKTEKIADKFSAWYIVLTFAAVIIIYLISHNSSLVLSILLITCADDIAVAIPLGFTIVISKAAKHGIIIKGADIIERLSKVDVFLTDKTGTLTRGDSKITDILTFGIDKNKFLEIAGICAINSNHPTSITIIEYLKQQHVDIIAPDNFDEEPGDGIAIKKGENDYFAGKLSFLESNGIKVTDESRDLIEKKKAAGESVVTVGANGKLIGVFGFEDEIRPNAKALVTNTKALGVKRWVMITGDNENVARRVAGQLGIDEYVANLKPEDKLEVVKKFRHRDAHLAMIGDGVNDAAALALADVSIAMGVKGADAAIEAADIALMHDDLSRIPEAIRLSRESIFIVKENFAIWGISNIVGLILVFGGILGPVGAAAYNFLTDFLPISNVFRIFNKKLTELPKNFK